MSYRIRRVGHLVLRVKDVERSRRFFEEVLRLPAVATNERGMVFFSTDAKDNHHMLAIMPATKADAAMPTLDHIGMQHVSFELGSFAELQDAWRSFKEKGVKVHYTVYHGVTKSIYFFDPDGNELEVYCNVPEEQYTQSVPNPYSRYGAIDDELDGKVGQKAGTIAP